MIPISKPAQLSRRASAMYRLGGGRSIWNGSASPQCILLAAAALAALLVSTSYSVVPYISRLHGTSRSNSGGRARRLSALEQIESLFPREVTSMMRRRTAEASLLNSQDLEEQQQRGLVLQRIMERRRKVHSVALEDPLAKDSATAAALPTSDAHSLLSRAAAEGEDPEMLRNLSALLRPDPNDPTRPLREEKRLQRQSKRALQLMAEHKAAERADEEATGKTLGRAEKPREAFIRTVTTKNTGEMLSTGGGRPAGSSLSSSLSASLSASQSGMGGAAGRGLISTATGLQASSSSSSSSSSLSASVSGGPGGSWQASMFREGQDQMVRLIKDQLIMARAYASIAAQGGNAKLAKELKARLKDSTKSLGDAEKDTDLAHNALEKMRAMGLSLAKAKERHYDCTALVKKLRAMVHATEDQNLALRRQGLFLSQVAARTVPKGLFCLHMRLTIDYWAMTPQQQELPGKEKLEDRSLYHYALFSDNVLACSVVVNSTIANCKNASQHVIHIVTDKLNYGAMKAWFLLNPPGGATVEVMNIDDFKWLNSSYCPVLRQLESAAMKEYYFRLQQGGDGKAEGGNSEGAGAQLKYRNPKYLSMLNHLRFYLPEVFPALDKVLFLDDDIVVQRDLTPLWEVDLGGNVNGAVDTCGTSFHRFDKYLNFSNPLISSSFDPQACGWAYGMNVFDLVQWKKKDITGIYHHWQNLNEDRTLWKLGTLPPGLITFYNLTHSLPKHWHFLGLGYNPNLDMEELGRAAVVHYNGNMKPWLEISMSKFKEYWSKYVDYGNHFLQACNING